MCDYCNPENTEEDGVGGDCIVYGKPYKPNDPCYYIYAEHFRNERIRIEVKFCPMCGKELNKEYNEFTTEYILSSNDVVEFQNQTKKEFEKSTKKLKEMNYLNIKEIGE